MKVVAFFVAACALATGANAQQSEPIVARTSEELLAALASADAGRQIRMLRGTYPVDRPISIPDGVAVVGEGVMHLDESGIASGMEPGTETTLVAASRFDGDILTLGNGARVQGLVLRDMEDDATGGTQRKGNVVAVVSRSAGDVVAASIVECEIYSPNPPGFTPDGPSGRGIVAMVRDSALPTSRPHEGAALEVDVRRSVVHGKRIGVAVFVINFAARAKTHVALSQNRFEGRFVATGGANRRNVVTHAVTDVESDHNLYLAPAGSEPAGWMLYGGSSSPHIATPDSPGPGFDTLRMRSVSDRIDGFLVGILAAAGRRVLATSGPASDNVLELDLTDLQIRTQGAEAADLAFYGALADPDPTKGREFVIGDRNTLRARIQDSHGSGPRANAYLPVFGPLRPANLSVNNRIRFVGNADEFLRSNAGIAPLPMTEYFTGERTAP